jgi:Flp pilus assembly protein TadB
MPTGHYGQTLDQDIGRPPPTPNGAARPSPPPIPAGTAPAAAGRHSVRFRPRTPGYPLKATDNDHEREEAGRGGLSVTERRRLAEIERQLRADARLAALLSDGPATGRRLRRQGRARRTPPLPWILLVSWLVLGLLFSALLTGAPAAVVAAAAVAAGAVLIAFGRGRRSRRE